MRMSAIDSTPPYENETETKDRISCPLGEICLFFDGSPVPFALYDSPSASSYVQDYPVDANKRLRWHYEPDGQAHILECRLAPEGTCEWDYACGERLMAIDIFDGSAILVITTEWDSWEYEENDGKGLEDYSVRIIENGLQFTFDESTRSHDIIIGASWLSGYTENTRRDPWLVGNPSIDKLR